MKMKGFGVWLSGREVDEVKVRGEGEGDFAYRRLQSVGKYVSKTCIPWPTQ